jgi:hypothetical protein
MLENLGFTKRERVFIGVLFVLLILAFIIPQNIIDQLEPLLLLCFATPMGFYIATDPERIKRENKK